MTIEKRKEQVLAMLTALYKTENNPTAIDWEVFLKHYGQTMSVLSYLLNNFLIEYSAVDAHSLYVWRKDLFAPTPAIAMAMIKDLNLDNHDLFATSKVCREKLPEKYLEALFFIYEKTKTGFSGSLSHFRDDFHLSGRFLTAMKDLRYVIYIKKEGIGKRLLQWNTGTPTMKMACYLLEESKKTRIRPLGNPKGKGIIDRKLPALWKSLCDIFRP